MNIVEFLKARLAEDESDARAAADVDGARWNAADPFSGNDFDRVEGSGDTTVGYDMHSGTCPHVARHDPARVLREIASKRAIIAKLEASDAGYGGGGSVDWSELPDARAGANYALWDALRALCTAYSDHPDFNADWSI